ncbi:MAG: hypothetical protein HY303_00100 [Candidatus Wallbacteria bacterium]|nr:hypothetical protein [Candidatus Wallbacteria bacterium]
MTLSGTVRHSKLEGGFWTLAADDGRTYQLDGGDGGLYHDGQRARVTGRIAADAAGIAMSGDILRVESYEVG